MKYNKEKRQILFFAFLSLIIPTLLIMINMRVWELDFSVPPATRGDAFGIGMIVESIKENGLRGLWFNDRIGAPEIGTLIDTPFLDYNLSIIVWLITIVTPTTFHAFYIAYILSYTLAGISGFILFRKVTKNNFLSLLFAILFALLPYHFYRGMGHFALSFYYVVAIGMCLVVDTYVEKFVGGIPEVASKSILRKILFYIAIVIVGLSNVYFSFFIMLTLLITVIIKAIQKEDWKILIHEGRVFGLIACFFLAGVAPKILYGLMSGVNTVAGIRAPQESEIYALKLIQMILPPSYCRIPFLAALNSSYNVDGFNINENAMACLGFAGVIGFIISCIFIFLKIIKSKWIEQSVSKLSILFSFVVLIFVLWCTAGGVGTIFNYVITPEIRGYNRASIVINISCLLILADLICRLINSNYKKMGFGIAIAVFFVCMVLDVPPVTANGYWESIQQSDNQYRMFFKEIESELEDGDMVYQLPVAEFPEYPSIVNMADYSHFKGYIYTDTLRWSYGAMKGRNHAAIDMYVDNGMSLGFINNIINAGFNGLYIDTDGYEDGGAQIISFYNNVLEQEPIISGDGKLYFYELETSEESIATYRTNYLKYVKEKSIKQLAYIFNISKGKISSLFMDDEEIDYGIVYDLISFDSTDVNSYICLLYDKLLNRTPSDEEIQGWVNNMISGMSSREVFIEFCNSDEFKQVLTTSCIN